MNPKEVERREEFEKVERQKLTLFLCINKESGIVIKDVKLYFWI